MNSVQDQRSSLNGQVINDAFHLTRLALLYGRVNRGVSHPDGEPESDTDHSISLTWLACSLAAKFYPHLDCGLIAQYAVAHDAPEIYAGDTYAVTNTDKAAQREREHDAFLSIKSELQSLSWLSDLINEYEACVTPESRFTHVVDKLMPKIVLRLEGAVGYRLKSRHVTLDIAQRFRAQETAELREVARDFPVLLMLLDDLNNMLDLENEFKV